MLLDEFEYVTQNPNFKADFFGGLRGLAIHHNLPVITATRRDLVDLCHSDKIKGSPFFNIFASVVLRPFSRQEVFALVDGYTKNSEVRPALPETELVYQLGGGNPFFIQMAGYYLVETTEHEQNVDAASSAAHSLGFSALVISSLSAFCDNRDT